MLLGLAVRNLGRQWRRTALSMGSVVAGVAVIILGQGVIGGLDENIVRAEIDGRSAHVMVRPAGYPNEGLAHPLSEAFAPGLDLTAFLDGEAAAGRIAAWAPRTLAAVRASNGKDSLRVRLVVVDPERDPAVFTRETWRVAGKVPVGHDDGALLSQGVAKLLGYTAPGEGFLVLSGRTADGAMNALQVPVAGIVTTGNPWLDKFGVIVPKPLGDDLLRPDGKVSHVHVLLPFRDQATAFTSSLTPHLPRGTETSDWLRESQPMLDLQVVRRRALMLLVLALMGMSATGIANTVLMAAYERIREIGTLRAMGMTEGGVLGLFVTEGMFIGIAGSALGAGLGSAVTGYYALHGIDLSAATQNTSGNLAIASMLYLEFNVGSVAMAVAFGIVVAVLASLWPARVASAMAPADAVRAD